MIAMQQVGRDPGHIALTLDSLFDRLGFNPSGTVFVKPNLCGRSPILEGENTTTYFMDGLLKALSDRGCFVKIGHSSLLGTSDRVYSFEDVIRDAGFDKYRMDSSVAVLNLDIEPRRMIGDDWPLNLPEVIFSADAYINLAKLKTHMETGVSLSMKNQMGLLSQEDRIRFHREALDEPIARLSRLSIPTVSILEAIVAMEGNGPHHGADKYLGTVLIGDDMLELDTKATRMMCIDPQAVGHLSFASALSTHGQSAAVLPVDLWPEFRPADQVMRIGPRLEVWPTTSCSRCITALNEAGRSLRSTLRGASRLVFAAYVGKPTSIVIGTPRPGHAPQGGRVFCVGRCAAHGYDGDAIRLDICSPSAQQVERFLRDHL